jgi:hypothetical protein
MAAGELADGVDCGSSHGHVAQCESRGLAQGAPGIGEPNGAPEAMEQLGAELRLETSDGLGDGRLRDAERVGRASEAALVDDAQEHLEDP